MRISINDLKTKFSSWKIPTGADWDNLIDTLAGRGNVEYYKVPNITGDIWRDVNSSTTLDGTFRATILIEYGGSQLYLFTYTQPILYGFTGRMTNQKEYVFYFYAIKGDKGDQG
ncbi:MAG: hypothetical protein KAH32_05500, partial [Chlamydiia bacterium]|nr:hypothetical protein [Chlamydiia bacterium]